MTDEQLIEHARNDLRNIEKETLAHEMRQVGSDEQEIERMVALIFGNRAGT